MKPAEFWAETPSELIDWIGTVSKNNVQRDVSLAWQISNLTKIGFHAPKKFPDLKTLLNPPKAGRAMTRAQREVELMITGRMKPDPATLPAWATRESKAKH